MAESSPESLYLPHGGTTTIMVILDCWNLLQRRHQAVRALALRADHKWDRAIERASAQASQRKEKVKGSRHP